MKLGSHAKLDALCGEYVIGTLRGAARRRFERALREEPLVSLRLRHWQQSFTPKYARSVEVQPSRAVWQRLNRELDLARYRAPWHKRMGFWRTWAVAMTVLAFVGAWPMLSALLAGSSATEIAQLAPKSGGLQVSARLTRDHSTLELQAARAIIAGPAQSYELWLLPAEGGAPISLAVLGNLNARFAVPPSEAGKLRTGAKLAVSVEPAGGSPTGAPTGDVILIGDVNV